MTPDSTDLPPDLDGDDDTAIAELAVLVVDIDDRFGERVRGRIERRLLGRELLTVTVTGSLTVFLEFVRVVHGLLIGQRPEPPDPKP
ncbi:MAG TPA: hypothetical protein VIY56_18390 [Vicinamibacterales bacterium]